MRHATRIFLILALVAGTCLISLEPVLAETTYTAILDGASAGTPSMAVGSATFVLNAPETEVNYTITYDGLRGVELAAHLHHAEPGMSGPTLTMLALGSPKTGTWLVENFEVMELNAGRVYINIHTDSFGLGEIRGNLTVTTVAAEAPSWSAIKAIYR